MVLTVLTVPKCTLDSLRWWLNPRMVGAGVPFHPPQPTLTLVTDASALGWGAHLGGLSMQGIWNESELLLHINIRELRAIHLACQAFLPHLRGHCVAVLTDNTTAMFYLNKQGGAQSLPLCQEALLLWDFCLAHSINLQASYLPGVQNVLADSLSRRFLIHEWSIRPDIIPFSIPGGLPELTCSLCGPTGSAQLSVSSRVTVRARERTPCRSRGQAQLLYAFPPFPLVHKVLLKVRRDKADVILVAPAWPCQCWYPVLLDLSIQTPLHFPPSSDLISQNHSHLLHPDLQSLHLTAWSIRG